MKNALPFWSRPLVYRTAIGLYILLLFGLAAASFAVSHFDVRGALYLRGHAEIEKGRANGMRGVFHYAPTGESLRPRHMDWQLLDREGQAYPVDFGGTSPQENWPDVQVYIPEEVVPGDYILEVRTSHERVPEFAATAEVEVVEASSPPALSRLDWPTGQARDDQANRRPPRVEAQAEFGERKVDLALTPADGELVRGMPARVVFRVFDPETGHPLPATLDVELTQGLVDGEVSEKIHTDSLGFAVWEVTPATDLELEVRVDDVAASLGGELFESAAGEGFVVRLSAVAAQFQVQPHDRLVLRGEPVEASVRSVLDDASYMVDFYEGKRLFETLTLSLRGGRGGARFATSTVDESASLMRLQVYQSLYGAENGWDSAYLLFIEEDSVEVLLQVARQLFGWIADSTEDVHYRRLVDADYLDEGLSRDQLQRLIYIGLEEIPRRFELPPVLMNTRQADREVMQIWQQEARADIRIMMALLLFGGVLLVLYFVILGIGRHQKEARILAEIDLEHDGPASTAQDLRAMRLERLTIVMQALIVLLTLLAFALGIIMVVGYL